MVSRRLLRCCSWCYHGLELRLHHLPTELQSHGLGTEPVRLQTWVGYRASVFRLLCRPMTLAGCVSWLSGQICHSCVCVVKQYAAWRVMDSEGAAKIGHDSNRQ
jgi:hypothetical protein